MQTPNEQTTTMRNILLFSIFLLPVLSFGQFRMVGSGLWSTLTDSTYSSAITFQSDLTASGYLATQIDTSFRLFTSSGQIYNIDSVGQKTFSSAELWVIEYLDTEGEPAGQVQVYDRNFRETIPMIPLGSTGATAAMQAAIATYNAAQLPGDVDYTVRNDSVFVLLSAVEYFTGFYTAPQHWYATQTDAETATDSLLFATSRRVKDALDYWIISGRISVPDNLLISLDDIVITHNLGSLNYDVVVTPAVDTPSGLELGVSVHGRQANQITARVFRLAGLGLSDIELNYFIYRK